MELRRLMCCLVVATSVSSITFVLLTRSADARVVVAKKAGVVRSAKASISFTSGGVVDSEAGTPVAAENPSTVMVSAQSDTVRESSTLALDEEWQRNLTVKLKCMRIGIGDIYFYHFRKAAGTTIEQVLKRAAQIWHVRYQSTEGIYLNRQLLGQDVLAVASIREPIARIISLYWYEHVAWYELTEKATTFMEWVSAWRDGSEWKRKYMLANPKSNYVEIENYYVKSLIGLQPNLDSRKRSNGKVDKQDLEMAKQVLASFDVVALVEWMSNDTHIDALNAVFSPPRSGKLFQANQKVNSGDGKTKDRFRSKLAPDMNQILPILKEINQLDLQLWDYAQSLLLRRSKLVAPLVSQLDADIGARGRVAASCNPHAKPPSIAFKDDLGLYQPPNHKGPCPAGC